jgi:hypothetical protein
MLAIGVGGRPVPPMMACHKAGPPLPPEIAQSLRSRDFRLGLVSKQPQVW